MVPVKARHLLEIHLAVVFFGIAGLFGKWILLPATIISLGRVVFASMALGVAMAWFGHPFRLNAKRDYGLLALSGLLLAIHWATFFQSIQVSTVAVGLLTYSTFPVFTVMLEPLFFREERFRLENLVLALITLGGVALVVPEWRLENNITAGAFWGVISGLTFALLALMNRKYIRTYSSVQIAFYQDLTAMLFLLPFFLLERPAISGADLALFILLGVVFTAASHSLFINGLKTVPARTASIIGSLEPVYGILGALLVFGEVPGWRVLAGGAIILGTAGYVTVRGRE